MVVATALVVDRSSKRNFALAHGCLLGWPTPDLVMVNAVHYNFRSRICTLLSEVGN